MDDFETDANIRNIISLNKYDRSNYAHKMFDHFDEEDCATWLLNVELIRRKLINILENR